MAGEGEEETPEMAPKDQPSEEKKEDVIIEESPIIPEQSTENLNIEVLPNNSAELRENLVHTAVSFLQNPKVRDGPVAQKKAFLRTKGLTEEEILDAFMRSGVADHVPQPMVPYPPPPPPPQIIHVPVVSSWMRIRETMVAGVLVWGLSKAAHRFYTEYVSPYFDLKRPQERRLEVIENSVLEMQNNLVETMKKVQEVVATVQHQQKQMLVLTEQLLKNMSSSGGAAISSYHNDQTANEIKAELNSIKGILLSRKQFPAVPTTTAGLPTWQLSASTAAAAPPSLSAAEPPAPSPAAPPAPELDPEPEPESKASKTPHNEPNIPPPPSPSPPPASNQTSINVEVASDSERVVSIEDNKAVDNPDLMNGESNEQQQQQPQENKQGSKKSKTKKEEAKKNNNDNIEVLK